MVGSPEQVAKRYGISLEQAKVLHGELTRTPPGSREISLQIFQLAGKYIESANALWKHVEAVKNANVAPGYIMCLSMGLELYFKCLVVLDYAEVYRYSELPESLRKKLSTHHIPSLFDLVPEAQRARLVDIYSARMSKPRLSLIEFREQLVEKASKVFIDWRYVYEDENEAGMGLDLEPINHLITSAMLVAFETKNPK